MPTQAELELSAANKELAELRGTIKGLEHRIEVLSKIKDEDWVARTISDLNRQIGVLTAQHANTVAEKEKLERLLETERVKNGDLLTRLADQGKQLGVTNTALEKAQTLAQTCQKSVLCRTWAPWAAAIVVILTMVYLTRSGTIITHTGNVAEDALNAANQTNQLLYKQRERDLELQKPDTIWNIKKTMSSDGKAIVTFQMYGAEPTSKEMKARFDFVCATVCSALHMKTVVVTINDNGQHEILTAVGEQENPKLVGPEYLNSVLGEGGLKMISEKMDSFDFGINVEYLESLEKNRYNGMGYSFRSGKFCRQKDEGEKG